jgi:hypothetical protein
MTTTTTGGGGFFENNIVTPLTQLYANNGDLA